MPKQNNTAIRFLFALGLIASPAVVQAQSTENKLLGLDSPVNLLSLDEAEKNVILDIDLRLKKFDLWKEDVKARTGLNFGFDYSALGYAADSSPGENTAASGAVRAFGTWDIVNRDGPNRGGLIFKVENRHDYGGVPPSDFSGELGYAGLVSSVFNDQGWRTTSLLWQQHFADGQGIAYTGWVDVTDFVDVFALASPWRGFSNLAFQTGSGTIGGLPDGALGTMVGGMLNTNFFAVAGIVDANADATDILSGFDTVFDDGETFKTVELGWTSGTDALFLNNAHITLWQIDERTEAGTPDGKGVAFSYTHVIDNTWLPFIRGGWSDDGGSLYEAAVSVGFGFTRDPGRSLMAVGLNWSRPNEGTFGSALDEQLTLEIFRRWQLTKVFELSPSLQIIKDPALSPDEDTVFVLGLRLRAAL